MGWREGPTYAGDNHKPRDEVLGLLLVVHGEWATIKELRSPEETRDQRLDGALNGKRMLDPEPRWQSRIGLGGWRPSLAACLTPPVAECERWHVADQKGGASSQANDRHSVLALRNRTEQLPSSKTCTKNGLADGTCSLQPLLDSEVFMNNNQLSRHVLVYCWRYGSNGFVGGVSNRSWETF